MASKRRQYSGAASTDPDKQAGKRARRKEAAKRGSLPTTRKKKPMSKSQASHASNPRARRKARDGQKKP